jgi:hypothetical protein
MRLGFLGSTGKTLGDTDPSVSLGQIRFDDDRADPIVGCADFSSDSSDRNHSFTTHPRWLHHHYVRV